MIDKTHLWLIIAGLAAGSFLLRYSFLGLIGDKALPAWVLRHLRYTAVAILPGIIAPLVVWPPATGGQPDAARLAAAIVALTVGILTKNVLLSILLGAATLFGGIYLTGGIP